MLDNDKIMTAKASAVVQKVQMKKIITNAPCTLWFPYSHSIFSRKGWMLIRHIQHS